jgi:FMN-dependent NADH-azoreductase
MRLLHITASPRGGASRTSSISDAFLAAARQSTHGLEEERVDLFADDLPSVVEGNLEAKYDHLAGRPHEQRHAASWSRIEREIERFRSADRYLITAPVWNFGTPYTLKYYIDCIVQPGYLFRYTGDGSVEPLLKDKKMLVVSSSGSDFSESSPLHALNFHEPYLRAVFGFVGITDVTFIHANALDTPYHPVADELAVAKDRVRQLALEPGWLN